MGLLNKKPEFVAAVCPLCGDNLELDANFEIARCKDCGAESIIRNVNEKEKKEKFSLLWYRFSRQIKKRHYYK